MQQFVWSGEPNMHLDLIYKVIWIKLETQNVKQLNKQDIWQQIYDNGKFKAQPGCNAKI